MKTGLLLFLSFYPTICKPPPEWVKNEKRTVINKFLKVYDYKILDNVLLF